MTSTPSLLLTLVLFALVTLPTHQFPNPLHLRQPELSCKVNKDCPKGYSCGPVPFAAVKKCIPNTDECDCGVSTVTAKTCGNSIVVANYKCKRQKKQCKKEWVACPKICGPNDCHMKPGHCSAGFTSTNTCKWNWMNKKCTWETRCSRIKPTHVPKPHPVATESGFVAEVDVTETETEALTSYPTEAVAQVVLDTIPTITTTEDDQEPTVADFDTETATSIYKPEPTTTNEVEHGEEANYEGDDDDENYDDYHHSRCDEPVTATHDTPTATDISPAYNIIGKRQNDIADYATPAEATESVTGTAEVAAETPEPTEVCDRFEQSECFTSAALDNEPTTVSEGPSNTDIAEPTTSVVDNGEFTSVFESSSSTPTEEPVSSPVDATPTEESSSSSADATPTEESSSSVADATPTEESSSSSPDATPTEESSTSVAEATPTEESSTSVSDVTPTEESSSSSADATPTEESSTSVSDVTPTEESSSSSADATPTEESSSSSADSSEPTPTGDAASVDDGDDNDVITTIDTETVTETATVADVEATSTIKPGYDTVEPKYTRRRLRKRVVVASDVAPTTTTTNEAESTNTGSHDDLGFEAHIDDDIVPTPSTTDDIVPTGTIQGEEPQETETDSITLHPEPTSAPEEEDDGEAEDDDDGEEEEDDDEGEESIEGDDDNKNEDSHPTPIEGDDDDDEKEQPTATPGADECLVSACNFTYCLGSDDVEPMVCREPTTTVERCFAKIALCTKQTDGQCGFVINNDAVNDCILDLTTSFRLHKRS